MLAFFAEGFRTVNFFTVRGGVVTVPVNVVWAYVFQVAFKRGKGGTREGEEGKGNDDETKHAEQEGTMMRRFCQTGHLCNSANQLPERV